MARRAEWDWLWPGLGHCLSSLPVLPMRALPLLETGICGLGKVCVGRIFLQELTPACQGTVFGPLLLLGQSMVPHVCVSL